MQPWKRYVWRMVKRRSLCFCPWLKNACVVWADTRLTAKRHRQCTVAESIQSANSLLLLQPSYTCGKWADLCPVWKVIRKISAGSQCSRLFDSTNQRRRCRWRWIATVVARNSTIAALGVNTGSCFWNYSHKAQVRMHSCLLLMSRVVDFSIFYLIEVILFYRRSVFWCIPVVEYSIWWLHLAFPSRVHFRIDRLLVHKHFRIEVTDAEHSRISPCLLDWHVVCP